jgi:hypothetical protein
MVYRSCADIYFALSCPNASTLKEEGKDLRKGERRMLRKEEGRKQDIKEGRKKGIKEGGMADIKKGGRKDKGGGRTLRFKQGREGY